MRLYAAVALRACAPAARDWLDRALTAPFDPGAFQTAYAGATRRVGSAAVTLDAGEEAAFRAADLPPPAGRPLDEVARAALLLRALQCLPSAEHPAFVDQVYRRGDAREQAALLRALAALPEPARFLPTAVEACRTNDRAVFAAIACDNAYPSRDFPDAAFNQMVLKVLFVGLPLTSVLGLPARITPELRRMAADYASERRAAARPVPPDIAMITGSTS